jgi:proline dehydrogenase
LCNVAAAAKIRILVDAEESWIQGAIDELTEERMFALNAGGAVVYQTVQLYRTDRLEYIKNLCLRCDAQQVIAGLKMVRGAYMEKERERALAENRPSPIHRNKASTDKAYNDALVFCAGRLQKTALCLGTHNEESTLLLIREMRNNGIASNHPNIHFAQLLGMSDHLTYNLSYLGYNVAKYVPYGPVRLVMPYLVRRATENTSVAGQTGRELHLIQMELKRRAKIQ